MLTECSGNMNIYSPRKIECTLSDVHWKYDFSWGIKLIFPSSSCNKFIKCNFKCSIQFRFSIHISTNCGKNPKRMDNFLWLEIHVCHSIVTVPMWYSTFCTHLFSPYNSNSDATSIIPCMKLINTIYTKIGPPLFVTFISCKPSNDTCIWWRTT